MLPGLKLPGFDSEEGIKYRDGISGKKKTKHHESDCYSSAMLNNCRAEFYKTEFNSHNCHIFLAWPFTEMSLLRVIAGLKRPNFESSQYIAGPVYWINSVNVVGEQSVTFSGKVRGLHRLLQPCVATCISGSLTKDKSCQYWCTQTGFWKTEQFS